MMELKSIQSMNDYNNSNIKLGIRDDSEEVLQSLKLVANNQGNPTIRGKAGIDQKQRDQKKAMRRSSMSLAIPSVSTSGIGDSTYFSPFLDQSNNGNVDSNTLGANTHNIKSGKFGFPASSQKMRSKASAFLLGVMQKKSDDKRELSDPFQAMFAAKTNSRTNPPLDRLSANRKSVERRSVLASPVSSFHRMPTSSSLLSLDHSQQSGVRRQTQKNDRLANIELEHEPLFSNETEPQLSVVEILHAIKANKKDLQKQVDLFCEILVRLQARNPGSRQSILDELVSQGIINEIVTTMREFRFHVGLQTFCINILMMISEASELYAYAMNDVDLDTIIEKAISIHCGQERLVMLSSALIHAIRESRCSDNVKKLLDEEAQKEKQRMLSHTEQVVASLQAKPKKQQKPENNESDTMSLMKSTLIGQEEVDHAIRGRFPCRSASGFRRAFAGDASPPLLSSSYSVAFTRRLTASNTYVNKVNTSQDSPSKLCIDVPKREINSAPITFSPSRLSSLSPSKTIGCEQKDKLRPSTTSSPVRNTSNHHMEIMASIYNGVPVFVEALPISERIAEVDKGNGSPYYKKKRLEMKSAGYIRHSPSKQQSDTSQEVAAVNTSSINITKITQDSTGDSELLDLLQSMNVGVAEKTSPHSNQKKTVTQSIKRPTTCDVSTVNREKNRLQQQCNAGSQATHPRPATATCSSIRLKSSFVKNVSGTHLVEESSEDRGADHDGDDDPTILQQVQDEYLRGLQHQKEGHLAKAIECYEKALGMKGSRQFAALYINLGSAYMCQREFERALRSFQRAEEIQPGNVKAIYNMGLALGRLGKPHDAQEKFTRVLKLDPMHEKAIHALNLAKEPVG